MTARNSSASTLKQAATNRLFGLQPWRMLQGHARIKSYALAWWDAAGTLQQAGKMWPTRADLTAVLERIAASGRYCLTWTWRI